MATDNEMNNIYGVVANALGQWQAQPAQPAQPAQQGLMGQSHALMHGQANQGLMAQNAAAMSWPPTVADTVARLRKTYAAKQKVLEFLEAQLALDLFKDDPAASILYQECINAAIYHMEKPQ